LAQLGIEDDYKLTDVEKSATILDLLTARSGVYLPTKMKMAGVDRWIAAPSVRANTGATTTRISISWAISKSE
jgi:hypothetical protein